MTLEKLSQENYTPLTFIKNARKFALRVAWDLDKAYTEDRHPNLARINSCGIGAAKYLNRFHDQSISEAETPIVKAIISVMYAPIKLTSLFVGYFVGTICGLIGSKPEDFQYDSRKLQTPEGTR